MANAEINISRAPRYEKSHSKEWLFLGDPNEIIFFNLILMVFNVLQQQVNK